MNCFKRLTWVLILNLYQTNSERVESIPDISDTNQPSSEACRTRRRLDTEHNCSPPPIDCSCFASMQQRWKGVKFLFNFIWTLFCTSALLSACAPFLPTQLHTWRLCTFICRLQEEPLCVDVLNCQLCLFFMQPSAAVPHLALSLPICTVIKAGQIDGWGAVIHPQRSLVLSSAPAVIVSRRQILNPKSLVKPPDRQRNIWLFLSLSELIAPTHHVVKHSNMTRKVIA